MRSLDLDPAGRLSIDEYVIEPDTMPGKYVARLALRYQPEQFAAALRVVYEFLNERYANVVVTGRTGSSNGDQISVWFWSSGQRAPLIDLPSPT